MIENAEDKKIFKSTPSFIPAGQTTQMIIGASGESDYAILSRSENLYKNFDLKRVYYSGYVPVNKSGILVSTEQAVPMIREHRLYQADWLLRFYDFKADEILDEKDPFVDPLLDPKTPSSPKQARPTPPPLAVDETVIVGYAEGIRFEKREIGRFLQEYQGVGN